MVSIASVSCSDDHFDVNPDVSSQQTLWQNIKSNPDLSEFAAILEQVYVSKSEGVSTTQTYADLFSNEQIFTVWAPKNGNIDAYIKLLSYDNADSTYRVEKELIQNQMVRYNHVLNRETADTLDLFNDKQTVFDQKNKTFGDCLIEKWNIGCSNGTLHIVNGSAVYTHNLYEYLGTNHELDSIYNFFKSFEKIEFNESASTQGPTINGNITWVDSVTYVNNQIFWSLGATLNSEDSLYAMILPTNKAWDTALKETKTFYNYLNTYTQKVPLDEDNDTTITTELSQEEIDSMLNLYSKTAICNNLVFNARYQYRPFDVDNPANCDSIKSTAGTVFYQPYLTNIFAQARPAVRMSNGYAYITDNFGYRARDTWAKDEEIVARMNANIDKVEKGTSSNGSSYFYRNDSTINFSYAKIEPMNSSVQPAVTYKLRNVLSCKYDIFVVMAYNTNAMLPTLFKVMLTDQKNKNGKQLVPLDADTLHNGGNKLFKNIPHFNPDPLYSDLTMYHDTIQLAEDYLFENCYYGLDYAYPTIKITTNVTNKDKSNYTKEMWIDRIILVAKGNDLNGED